MAIISTYTQDAEVTARLAAAKGYIAIFIGESYVIMPREQAAQLAADLLNIAGVTPVDVEVAA